MEEDQVKTQPGSGETFFLYVSLYIPQGPKPQRIILVNSQASLVIHSWFLFFV